MSRRPHSFKAPRCQAMTLDPWGNPRLCRQAPDPPSPHYCRQHQRVLRARGVPHTATTQIQLEARG